MLELPCELLEFFEGNVRETDDAAQEEANVVAFLTGELDGVVLPVKHPSEYLLHVFPCSLTFLQLLFRNGIASTMVGDGPGGEDGLYSTL